MPAGPAEETATFANAAVLEFYRTLPFNTRETVEGSVEAIRGMDCVAAYPILGPLLKRGLRVLDVGCGTGWFSNALAHHHGAAVTGLDFNSVAIERARAVAAVLNLSTTFEVGDLFRFEPAERFDLVVSLGVLHHTDDCDAAVRRACERFVKPGGHVLIGLYHRYGRRPLLDHFQAMKDRGATEAEMLEAYRGLHVNIQDETMLVSWFRDQVLHPHETQHTLEELSAVLASADMDIVSTSINRFAPIDSLPALFAEEKKYYDVGIERLKEGKYFTGFFVVLARKRQPVAGAGSVDSKPYVEHHPLFGYHYIPNARLELPRPDGGRYQVRVNADGIRSDREYSRAAPDGVRRVIVCGDSMAAGQFLTNVHRFSELLERRIPRLEVINLALEGSGTDQQLLLYEHLGLEYAHDAVILLPFLQNVRRNMVDAREGVDPKTGRRVLRPKPRFELVDGRLVLRNVPVPRDGAEAATSPVVTDAQHSRTARLKERLTALPGAAAVKRVLYGLVPWEPFPEYANPASPEWQLMSALVRRFKELAGDRPLVLAPTFYASYVRFRMARNYWARYAELSRLPGVYPVDLLPHFTRLGKEAVNCFQEPHDMHFSAYGHLILAEALQVELSRLRLLPGMVQ